jgi:glucan phosphoethanolaminetransferase (alkaline phosphatase superfamily)
MHNRLLRPLLIVEFLIALQTFYTLWSQVGGQYHLDLMFWPWKLGLGVAVATLIVAITASIIRQDGAITRRALTLASLLFVTLAIAGLVTYYYHLNEPVDQQEDDEDEPAKISNIMLPESPLPGLAGFAPAHHR